MAYTFNQNYDARYTVPIIWDNKTQTIVNNESADIIRSMNSMSSHLHSLQGSN